MIETISAQRITADGVIGDSGMPISLYGYCIESTGTAAKVIFRNGTSASASEVFNDTGTISVSVNRAPAGGMGIVFPSGLFVDVDANTTSCTVFYRQIRT